MLACILALNGHSQVVSIDNSFGQNGKTIIPNTTEIGFFDFYKQGNIIASGIATNDAGKYNITMAKPMPMEYLMKVSVAEAWQK